MDKTEVLAVVGNREITRRDVDALLHSLNPQTATQFQSEEGMKNLVRELVNQELFYLDAMDNEIDKEQEYLQEVEKVKSNILKQYALNKLLCNIVVSEDEIVNYYSTNKSRFTTPPSVKASHILVDDIEKAKEIEDEIKGGLTFEDAAKKYSKCPSSQQGGDLGFFSAGMMVPEFEKAAFEMEKDQISSPVKTQFGYHLIKVYEKRDETIKSIDEVRDQLKNQLLAQKQQDLYLRKANELKGKYSIKVNI